MSEELLNLILMRVIQTLAIGCVFAATFFITWPARWAKKTNGAMNKWVSTSKVDDVLAKVRDVDDHILKLSKILGLTSLILAIILIQMCFRY